MTATKRKSLIFYALLATMATGMSAEAGGGAVDDGSVQERTFSGAFGKNETRGLISSPNRAEISARLDGVITKLPFREGDSFKKGDLLIAFDCRRYQAQLDVAEANEFLARKRLESTEKLLARGAASPFEMDVAKGEYKAAKAEMQGISYLVSQCSIRAPYNGVMSNVKARLHENATAGRRLFTIIDNSILEVELIVASSWLNWLKVGAEFKMKVNETDKTYEGRIAKLGGEVDPVSRSLKITGVLKNPQRDLITGMSGSVYLEKNTADGGG